MYDPMSRALAVGGILGLAQQPEAGDLMGRRGYGRTNPRTAVLGIAAGVVIIALAIGRPMPQHRQQPRPPRTAAP